MDRSTGRPRIGLVLGVGGIMGGAWLAGALEALAAETGWEPSGADHLVGSSAGSIMAALLAGGTPAEAMADRYRRQVLGRLPDDPEEANEANTPSGLGYRPHRALPRPGPGSWPLALGGLARPWRHRPAALMAGWLPRGVVSHDSLRDALRSILPAEWPTEPTLWIIACDYSNGRRVAFGRAGSPPAELADAVTASCAIPGFYYPVTIAGRSYVDGGLWSASNLDVLRGEALDLVICLNPTSSWAKPAPRGPAERLAATWRGASGRRLGWEQRRLRAAGMEVVLIQPQEEDLVAMGPNMMRRRGVAHVIEVARQTTVQQLRRPELAEPLRALETDREVTSGR